MSSFVDTNILIYGLAPSIDDPMSLEKSRRAVQLIDELTEAGDLVISTQVMSEFFVVSTSKAKPPLALAAAALVLERMTQFHVVALDSELAFAAVSRVVENQLSYWDALIVEAALRAKTKVLYSEDMQHGMRFGSLQGVNPFLSGA